MYKHLLGFCLLLLPFLGWSQAAIFESDLYEQLTDPQKQTEFFRVRILLADQVDAVGLSQQLDRNQADPATRIKTVVKALMEKANKTQGPLLTQLNLLSALHRENIKFYQPYWIANLVVVDAQPHILLQLANSVPGLAMIDRDLDLEFTHDPVLEEPGYSPNAINGSEIGLRVIKADSLWRKGYTGRGRLAMIIDSGTSFAHPALNARWRGNFMPAAQSWLGPGSTPNECGGNHGTHVMGIVLGLNRAQNDTIGAAVNAQWISAGGLCSGGPSTTAAFQWALNPDNDTSTTYDVPDVINNSWGGSQGTSQCNGTYVPIFNALEAAGVAVVFSAGNSGPGISTITSPKNINTNEVNVFCVGNINGNNASLPIANSSSRGPSICTANDSALIIKPEVVAPGTSVRSSVGSSGYSNFSGTSMAAPHVSGGVLLLKEAFPQLPGSEILRAIYYSAIDMGVTGEDNTYGNGRVDLNAAFNYLAQTHTPATPVGGDYNIKAEGIDAGNNILCEDSLRATISIRNIGDSVLQAVNIRMQINQQPVQNYRWTGNLASNTVANISLPALHVSQPQSNNQLRIHLSLDTNLTEVDTFDNNLLSSFQIRNLQTSPYLAAFEEPSLSQMPVYVRNPDNGIGWNTGTSFGLPNSQRSALMNCYAYSSRGQRDYLETNRISLPDTGQASLHFYLAYAENPGNSDSLFVEISTDCGLSFPHQLYANGGANMGTASARNIAFTPLSRDDWRRIDLPLNNFIGQDIVVRFTVRNDFGNNLYIDQVRIATNSDAPVADFTHEILPGCAPVNMNLQANALYANQLQWQLNNNAVGSTNPLALNNVSSGSQQLRLIASNTHGSDTLSYTMNVPVAPNVVFNIINDTVRQFQQILLVNQSQFASEFLWDFGDGTTSTLFGPAKAYNDTGWYTITLTGIANGCSIVSTQTNAVYVLGATVSIDEQSLTALKIYPNPAKDVLTIESALPASGGIRVVNLLGSHSKQLAASNETSYQLALHDLPPGIYLLQYFTEKGVIQQKFVKE